MFTSEEKVFQKFKLLANNEDFCRDVVKVRKKYSFSKDIESSQVMGKLFDNQEAKNDIEEIRKKYKLSTLYTICLHCLIKYDGLIKGVLPYSYCLPHTKSNKDNNKDYVDVRIFKETTLKDLREFWPFIQGMLEKDPKKRNKKLTNFERDEEIFELKKKGEKNIEIMKIINKKYDEIIGCEDISKIVSSFKKQVKYITL